MVTETFTVSKKVAIPATGLHLYERPCDPNNVAGPLQAPMVHHLLVQALHRARPRKGEPRDRSTSHRRCLSLPSTTLK